MKLKLFSTIDVNGSNIRTIQRLLKENTLVFITAKWCSFCISFTPEKKKILDSSLPYNIIDINDVALNELKSRDYSTWKLIVPDDHRVYFPMIISIRFNSTKNRSKIDKKVYNGPRTSCEIKEFMKKMI